MTIHALIAAQVAMRPDARAVVCDGEALTFAELDARATRLAQHLVRCGVGPEVIVGVHLERSLELVVALYAVLKAGGAYLPLDPSYPADRLTFMLADSRTPVVITRGAMSVPFAGRIVDLADRIEGDAVLRDVDPAHLAYIIYTSGSTGRPKGVQIPHDRVVRLVTSTQPWFHFDERDVWTCFHSYSFDVSVFEIWGALITGGTVVVVTERVRRSPGDLVALLAAERVTVLSQTPSVFSHVIAAARQPLSLRLIIFAGEALDLRSLVPWFERYPDAPRLINMYGITETTVHATYRVIEPSECATATGSPIGVPIPDLELHLLDAALERTREGEIFVGGAGVARGYHDRPALTAERFVPDPFSGRPGARMYKSGDLARESSGGLDYLGRADDQVKIRGFRVEPNEIAVVLREHPEVRDAAIVPRDEGGERRLFAYVVPKSWPGARYVLPNNLAIAQLHRHETDYNFHEIFELQIYLRHGIRLPDHACILDVGANIGMFSLFAAQLCAAPRILAFEPNPAAYEVLHANLAAHVPNGRAFACGVAAKPGEATFTAFTGYSLLSGFHADAATAAKVVKSYVANQAAGGDKDAAQLSDQVDAVIAPRFETKQFTVELRTLAEVIATEHVEHIDLLKVDVEKAEVDVLAGLSPADWRRIDQIVAEVDSDANVAAIEAMLRANDFDHVVDLDPQLANTGLRYVYAVRRGSGISLDSAPHHKPIAMLPPPFLTKQRLLAYCRERLPGYMVPSAFVLVDHLPLTPNGKLDRRALPAPAIKTETLEGGSTLERLAAIWSQLLATQDVAADDSFFDIGGTSLLAIRLESRIEDAFGVGFPLARILEHHTLGQMAEAIDQITLR